MLENNLVVDSIRDHIENFGVIEGKFTGTSSHDLNNYYDIKSCIVESSDFTNMVCNVMSDLLAYLDFDTIVSVALGGTLIADRLIQYNHSMSEVLKNYLIVRKESKNHGTCSNIIGNTEISKKVVIIEDVVTTGNSVLYTIGELESLGIEQVVAVFSVLDRSNQHYINEKCNLFRLKIENMGGIYIPLITV